MYVGVTLIQIGLGVAFNNLRSALQLRPSCPESRVSGARALSCPPRLFQVDEDVETTMKHGRRFVRCRHIIRY